MKKERSSNVSAVIPLETRQALEDLANIHRPPWSLSRIVKAACRIYVKKNRYKIIRNMPRARQVELENDTSDD